MLWTLIAANIGMFLLAWLLADRFAFFQKFGFVPAEPSLFAAQSSMFLHAGFLHLFANLFFLWIFGDNVEDVIGPLFFLIVFVLGGMAGIAAYYIFEAGSITPLVGTSAAVSAILGVYWVFFPQVKAHLIFHFPGRSELEADPIRSSVLGVVGAWFLEQIMLLIASTFTTFHDLVQVSIPASIAGFVVGIVCGLIFAALGYMRRYSISRERHWLLGYAVQPPESTGTDVTTVPQVLYEKFPWLPQRQGRGKSEGAYEEKRSKSHVPPRA